MTDSRMGEVLRDGDRVGLRYVRELAHPVEKVWRAITASEGLRHWMPCDIVGERRTGAAVELPFWPGFAEKYGIEEPVLPGRIVTWEPPRLFEWTWGGDALRFELEPTDDGTRLTFTTWPESPDPDQLANTAGGYHVCLDQLARFLATGEGGVLHEDAASRRWEQAYGQAVRTG
jgi:uncharacterized protein YndB with AHSA1/START domain